jgi:hypothetical protein
VVAIPGELLFLVRPRVLAISFSLSPTIDFSYFPIPLLLNYYAEDYSSAIGGNERLWALEDIIDSI